LSLIEDTKVRSDVPINPEAYCVGPKAAAGYIEGVWGLPIDAVDLDIYNNVAEGPPIDRVVGGEPIYAKDGLDGWVITKFGNHDGSTVGKRTMLYCYFRGDQPGYGHYEPFYTPSTGQVGLNWVYETPPTEEQIARWAAERDRLDPVIEDQLDMDNPVSDGRPA
jgi:hypothetical protein